MVYIRKQYLNTLHLIVNGEGILQPSLYKAKAKSNSILLFVLAVILVFGTGKFASLFALRTSEMTGFVNVIK